MGVNIHSVIYIDDDGCRVGRAVDGVGYGDDDGDVIVCVIQSGIQYQFSGGVTNKLGSTAASCGGVGEGMVAGTATVVCQSQLPCCQSRIVG